MIETKNTEIVCSVCGNKSVQTVLAKSKPATGAPDLDIRPAGEPRHYLKYMVMECPHCGYCAPSLDRPFDDTREYLESEEYKTCGGIISANEAAAKLTKNALVFMKNHNYKDAVRGYLSAAWEFDDENDERLAKECRKRAVQIMDEHPAAFKGDNNYKLLKADLLRRSGEFDRVIREYEGTAFPSQIMTAIAFFEVHLAASMDSAAHRADEVPGVSAAN